MPPVPNVSVKKSAVGASPALQNYQGVLAIIASASTGTAAQCGIYSNQAAATAQFGYGPLPEYGVYDIDVSGRPALLQRSTCSVPGVYGSITSSITGGGSVAAGSTVPLEHYSVQVKVVAGFTVGIAGGTYTWSVDGGGAVSLPTQVGTSATITLPNTGVSFTLTGTFAAGDSWSCFTERSLLNDTDLAAALIVLNNTRLPWEGLLVDCEYVTGSDPVGQLDTWLASRETTGQFNFAAVNTRYLLEPTPTAETPATYSAAMIALTQNDASNRLCVGADGGHVVSLITGYNLKRPTALALCAMAMSTTPNIGTDPSFVGLGPVPGYQISVGSNPNDWDDALYGGSTGILDPARLVTLRSFAPGGPQGTYITNPNVLVPSTSNIVYLQLLRVLNAACSVAWQLLNTQLSKGVNTIYNSTTQNTNIDPSDAQVIEGVVNPPLNQALAGQVTQAAFDLNRDDALNTPGAPVSGQVAIVGKFYIKGFNITVALVKTISAPVGGA